MTISSDDDDISMFNGGRAEEYHVFENGKYRGRLDQVMIENFLTPAKWDKEFTFIFHTKKPENHMFQWFRADGTPMRSGDVPKAYIAMATLVS